MNFKTCVKLGFGAYIGWNIAKGIDNFFTKKYGDKIDRKLDDAFEKFEAKLNEIKT